MQRGRGSAIHADPLYAMENKRKQAQEQGPLSAKREREEPCQGSLGSGLLLGGVAGAEAERHEDAAREQGVPLRAHPLDIFSPHLKTSFSPLRFSII